ncbi:cell envelope integrity protein TolA [Vibrio agarivorans]|uniref:cell envelope integrity protein TolA n=1 Tax=Vibrio agarivorans TaxID=153622 RepID=UPI002230DF73|nr:cell envelope integrity protein TolA [Vibrio agarivorans]
MRERRTKKHGLGKPLAISFGIHAAVIIALLVGTDFSVSKPEPQGQMVQAVVVDPAIVRNQAQQIRAEREAAAKREQDRLDKLRRESEQLEKNRRAEEERIRKLKEQQAREAKAAREAEAARQKKEQERKAEEERVRQQQERVRQEQERAAALEVERKAKEEAIRKAEEERVAREKAAAEAEERARIEREAAEKAEQERIEKERAAKEAAEKARQEQERLERLERERQEQEAALNDIFAGMEAESQLNQAAQVAHNQSEIDHYSNLYIQYIEQRLRTEERFYGKECRVNLRLTPTATGAFVQSVTIRDGDPHLCSAAKTAIVQVGNFPMPKDQPELVNILKDINLTVKPQRN